MKIAIGSDEFGLQMKQNISSYLQEQNGITLLDVGCYDSKPVLYADIAYEVAKLIQSAEVSLGILICGTGIGMSISANKMLGIRAAVCHDIYSTERSRKSNDTQIICFGAQIIAPNIALELLKLWLQYDFKGGKSALKVERIKEIENMNLLERTTPEA